LANQRNGPFCNQVVHNNRPTHTQLSTIIFYFDKLSTIIIITTSSIIINFSASALFTKQFIY